MRPKPKRTPFSPKLLNANRVRIHVDNTKARSREPPVLPPDNAFLSRTPFCDKKTPKISNATAAATAASEENSKTITSGQQKSSVAPPRRRARKSKKRSTASQSSDAASISSNTSKYKKTRVPNEGSSRHPFPIHQDQNVNKKQRRKPVVLPTTSLTSTPLATICEEEVPSAVATVVQPSANTTTSTQLKTKVETVVAATLNKAASNETVSESNRDTAVDVSGAPTKDQHGRHQHEPPLQHPGDILKDDDDCMDLVSSDDDTESIVTSDGVTHEAKSRHDSPKGTTTVCSNGSAKPRSVHAPIVNAADLRRMPDIRLENAVAASPVSTDETESFFASEVGPGQKSSHRDSPEEPKTRGNNATKPEIAHSLTTKVVASASMSNHRMETARAVTQVSAMLPIAPVSKSELNEYRRTPPENPDLLQRMLASDNANETRNVSVRTVIATPRDMSDDESELTMDSSVRTTNRIIQQPVRTTNGSIQPLRNKSPPKDASRPLENAVKVDGSKHRPRRKSPAQNEMPSRPEFLSPLLYQQREHTDTRTDAIETGKLTSVPAIGVKHSQRERYILKVKNSSRTPKVEKSISRCGPATSILSSSRRRINTTSSLRAESSLHDAAITNLPCHNSSTRSREVVSRTPNALRLPAPNALRVDSRLNSNLETAGESTKFPNTLFAKQLCQSSDAKTITTTSGSQGRDSSSTMIDSRKTSPSSHPSNRANTERNSPTCEDEDGHYSDVECDSLPTEESSVRSPEATSDPHVCHPAARLPSEVHSQLENSSNIPWWTGGTWGSGSTKTLLLDIDGVRYKHVPLPPGWHVSLRPVYQHHDHGLSAKYPGGLSGRRRKREEEVPLPEGWQLTHRPYYEHPDHNGSFHCPVNLTCSCRPSIQDEYSEIATKSPTGMIISTPSRQTHEQEDLSGHEECLDDNASGSTKSTALETEDSASIVSNAQLWNGEASLNGNDGDNSIAPSPAIEDSAQKTERDSILFATQGLSRGLPKDSFVTPQLPVWQTAADLTKDAPQRSLLRQNRPLSVNVTHASIAKFETVPLAERRSPHSSPTAPTTWKSTARETETTVIVGENQKRTFPTQLLASKSGYETTASDNGQLCRSRGPFENSSLAMPPPLRSIDCATPLLSDQTPRYVASGNYGDSVRHASILRNRTHAPQSAVAFNGTALVTCAGTAQENTTEISVSMACKPKQSSIDTRLLHVPASVDTAFSVPESAAVIVKESSVIPSIRSNTTEERLIATSMSMARMALQKRAIDSATLPVIPSTNVETPLVVAEISKQIAVQSVSSNRENSDYGQERSVCGGDSYDETAMNYDGTMPAISDNKSPDTRFDLSLDRNDIDPIPPNAATTASLLQPQPNTTVRGSLDNCSTDLVHATSCAADQPHDDLEEPNDDNITGFASNDDFPASEHGGEEMYEDFSCDKEEEGNDALMASPRATTDDQESFGNSGEHSRKPTNSRTSDFMSKKRPSEALSDQESLGSLPRQVEVVSGERHRTLNGRRASRFEPNLLPLESNDGSTSMISKGFHGRMIGGSIASVLTTASWTSYHFLHKQKWRLCALQNVKALPLVKHHKKKRKTSKHRRKPKDLLKKSKRQRFSVLTNG